VKKIKSKISATVILKEVRRAWVALNIKASIWHMVLNVDDSDSTSPTGLLMTLLVRSLALSAACGKACSLLIYGAIFAK
jgi:hypothetical protein